MPAENANLAEVFIGGADGAGVAACAVSVDTTTLSGTAAVGSVSIEGTSHVVVVTTYPASDVSSLNVSSLGSKVRTALLSLT